MMIIKMILELYTIVMIHLYTISTPRIGYKLYNMYILLCNKFCGLLFGVDAQSVPQCVIYMYNYAHGYVVCGYRK